MDTIRVDICYRPIRIAWAIHAGDTDSRIDLGLLTKLFRDSFDRGEELFGFIREAYDKRIEIVHPSPSSGANWQPFLMADDYYEYFDIVRELLNWILIDRKIAQ